MSLLQLLAILLPKFDAVIIISIDFKPGSVVVDYVVDVVTNSTQDAGEIVQETMETAIATGNGLPEDYKMENPSVMGK